MNSSPALLACGSMHFPWWVAPAVWYLLIGWGIGGFLVLFNLIKISTAKKSPEFKTSNVFVWAVYACPILLVAAMLCQVLSPQLPPVSAWIGYTLCAYVFLVPPMAVWHTVFLVRRSSPPKSSGEM